MIVTEVYYKTWRHYFPELPWWMDEVDDGREAKRTTYRRRDMVGSTISLFLFKEGSRRQFNEDRGKGEFAKNVAGLFHLTGVPHGDTPADFYRASDPESLHALRVRLVKRLLRQRVLEPYRLLDRYYLLAFDGTGMLTYSEKHCEACLSQKLSNGSTRYYHPILEAKIVCGNGLVISVGTEFIENQPGQSKQDCELKAFYRLAPRIKADFPHVAFCALMDGLYAGEPTFKLCKDLSWPYLIVLQDDDLSTVWSEVESLRPLNTENQHRRQVRVREQLQTERYSWTEDIRYHGQTVHVLEFWGPRADPSTRHWAWITDLRMKWQQVVEIVHFGGRQRWQLENRGFNLQKNHGYGLEHQYSRDTQVQKCFYLGMQIAHLLDQLVELGSLLKAVYARSAWSLKGVSKDLLAQIKERVLPWSDWQAGFMNNFQIRLNDTS
jgi:hypothetical protein